MSIKKFSIKKHEKSENFLVVKNVKIVSFKIQISKFSILVKSGFFTRTAILKFQGPFIFFNSFPKFLPNISYNPPKKRRQNICIFYLFSINLRKL